MKETSLAKYLKFRIEPPKSITSNFQCWGLDPGSKNCGIAVIPYVDEKSYIDVYQITMPPWKDAIDRITHWQDVLGELPLIISGHCRMVIEGPAYATRYRREELEDIRAATALWAYRLGIETKMVQPTSIWKEVFGSGRIPPSRIWYLKDAPDAVAALACAYYASEYWEK